MLEETVWPEASVSRVVIEKVYRAKNDVKVFGRIIRRTLLIRYIPEKKWSSKRPYCLEAWDCKE